MKDIFYFGLTKMNLYLDGEEDNKHFDVFV